MSAPEIIDGAGALLLVCDHASAAVPGDIDLGVDPEVLGYQVAVDIGAGELTRVLAARLGAPAVLGTVSRLVTDLNRDPDHPGLVPLASDGHVVPGNEGADRAERIARFHDPYHDALAAEIAARRPAFIAAIHSFTPCLRTGGTPRPWQVGVLYNRDERAARLLLDLLGETGLTVGNNEPYSGRLLNATLDRHAEAAGISSASIEVRNDGIDTPEGVERWAGLLATVLAEVRDRLARGAAPAA